MKGSLLLTLTLGGIGRPSWAVSRFARTEFSFTGQSVLLTGGSRGLGLTITRQADGAIAPNNEMRDGAWFAVVQAKRLFVSLDLPEPVAAALVRLDPQQRGVRWLHVGQLHLTLGFLGNVEAEAEERLRQQLLALRFTAFFLALSGLGVFPAKGRPKIIWIGVGAGHPHLFQLHKRVQEAALAAGLEADLRPWHPHITLARCQDVSAESIRPFIRARGAFDGGLIRIDSFQLKSSQLLPAGSVYTTELSVPAFRR